MTDLLTVIILTKNEEVHLDRLLQSLKFDEIKVCIVDSYSNDTTLEIASNFGASIYQNPFVNHAIQFQWALDNCDIRTPWIMRMDADEYLTQELQAEILTSLPGLAEEVTGVILKRQVHFMGKWIRFGGYYPIKLLRIWRKGYGAIEQRWMDEHMVVRSGKTVEFRHDIIDDNLNNLTWWTDKHNHYATREAIDILNLKHNFMSLLQSDAGSMSNVQSARKRWYKTNIYTRLPLFLRAFLYFNYRYFVLLGFLDGRPGLIWHFLQGFWYRFLVDAKICQIRWWAAKDHTDIPQTIRDRFNMDI